MTIAEDEFLADERRQAAEHLVGQDDAVDFEEQPRVSWLHQTDEERTQATGTNPTEEAGVDGRRYTDTGNAERLIAHHGDELRYVPTWQRWLAWEGARWLIDHDGVRVDELAKNVARVLFRSVEHAPGRDERQRLVRWATRSESAGGIRATVRLARTIPGTSVHHEELDTNAWILNITNGTIDLRDGRMRPHYPEDLVTRLAPVEYRGDAPAPRFHAFLERILPDPDVRAYLQRFVGYCLTGDVSEQVMVVAHGAGANGKSTLLEILRRLLGDYAATAPRELLLAARHEQHPTMFSQLFRARLATVVEVRDGGRLDEAQMKALTGGDRITTRRMREDFWEFDPTHKFVLACNHKPTIRGTDLAIWRRVHLVPFTITIPDDERDGQLAQRIIGSELSGVLAWALDGCLAWQKHGLNPPASVQAATNAYREESDLVARFLTDEGLVLGTGLQITAKELQDRHEEWSRSTGLAISWRNVAAGLTERGASTYRTKNNRGWRGIGEAAGSLALQGGDT